MTELVPSPLHSHECGQFHHDKGLLVRLVQMQSVERKDLQQEVLRVVYDAERRPVRLISGLAEHRFAYEKVTGQLVAWHSTALQRSMGGGVKREQVNEVNPEFGPTINVEAADDPGLAESGAQMAGVRLAYYDDLLMAIRWPGGRLERFKWDVAKGVLTEDMEATYITTGNLSGTIHLARTDREGRTVRVRYDAFRQQMTRTEPDGTSSTTHYQRRAAGNGLLREKLGADGRTLVRIDYNDRHLPVRVRELGKPEIRNVYDERDRLIEVWRAPSAPLEEALPSGTRSGAVLGSTATEPQQGELWRRFTYDGGLRQPATVANALGETTRFAYDERGQLTEVRRPSGAVTAHRYDPWGRLVYKELPGGYREQFKYDEHGRLVERKAVDGTVTTLSFDTQGRIRQRTEAGEVFIHRYDDLGRPVEVHRNHKPWLKWNYGEEAITLQRPKAAPASWVQGPAVLNANVVIFTDPQGNRTKRYFDADGRLMEVVNALGERASYRYNKIGELIGWVDARGHAVVFTRDSRGRIVKQENALGQTLSWTFDAAGRLGERANGVQTARYRFDAAGRLAQVDHGKGQVVTYERDGYGRLLGATTAEVSTVYRYDALDRPVRVEQRPRVGEPSGVTYAYSPDGQKSMVTVLRPDSVGRLVPGSVTKTSHDGLGRVVAIALDEEMTARHVYEPATPRLATKFLGNGLSYRYGYDSRGRMARLEVIDNKGSLKQRLHYHWDDYGQLARKVLEVSGANPVELHYGYDPLGRLATVNSPQDSRQSRRYGYDEAGNLVENRSHERWLTMEYDAANQLVTKKEVDGEGQPAEVTTFGYDRAGRMVRESAGGQVERSFTYGYLDKVLSVDRPGGRRAEYAYDASGMLVRKAVQDPTEAAGNATSWETWVWDGLALVQRGNEVYVNEPHAAGGMTLMSRSLAPEGAVGDAAGGL